MHCKELKKLYLYSNKISTIQNLSNVSLEVLWLNDNKIERIEVRIFSIFYLLFKYILILGDSAHERTERIEFS
jgi:Leucine-rich repeat (LRR) protein